MNVDDRVEVFTFTHYRRNSGGYRVKMEKSWQPGRVSSTNETHAHVLLDVGLEVTVRKDQVR